jgi:hypothetical protein
MERIKNTSLLFVLYAGLCVVLNADVAPPTFPGYSLSLFDAKDVRMTSEKVDIYYGKICKVEAVFEILNSTNKIVEKKIGFPFNPSAYSSLARRKTMDTTIKIYDFTMSLNGENMKITDDSQSRELQPDKQDWYGWTCKFKPGLNNVKLTYNTLTSFGNSWYKWEKTLYYYFTLDNNWPDKIDNVQVTVHFSESIAKRQILAETSPLGYEIKEKEIRWRFTSFTPKRESYIDLHLIDFKFFADMTKYEKVLSSQNADNATKLEAAMFFSSLAPYKGIKIYAPTRFIRSYYDETILPNLKPSERALFDSTYKLNKGSGGADYYNVHDDNYFERPDVRRRVLKVMNRIGYFEKNDYPVIYKYIVGAKRLFHEVVTSEPKNAAAWRAYIENYYLIETGACGPCLPWIREQCDCPESQKEIIREAFRNCGNDSTIAVWNNFLFPTQAPLPDTLKLASSIKPQEKTSIMVNLGGNCGWNEIGPLSHDEFTLINKAYTMSSNGYLVLNDTHLDEDTQKKLVEILGGCSLYLIKFCRDLEKLKKRGY